ncbi:TetR/AcrR family transcriptional regulator [Burkholderia cepacia]|uniref:TetR/AcrR family transcriptional regulator n=1 Tax=Burkholderia cepacia TaxID=292 RepID=UPI0021C79D25|nr:TetR/AcrR family transcriptional regulator [Burkholderia cepacia]
MADIMSAAGLTPGGFYRHFESKDHLVAEACDVASATLYGTLEAFVQGKPPREARREIAERYLSVAHRDNMSIGCPFAALGGDMARADSRTRQVAGGASAMIGALMMSRVVNNEVLSEEILQAARDALCR